MTMGLDLKAAAENQNLGDVNSEARGSGARYITGKPDLSLIPIRLQLEVHERTVALPKILLLSLGRLADFQESGDKASLLDALSAMHEYMEEAAHVLTYGTRKYKAWNWAKGMSWSACIGCAMRHVAKIARGEEIDDESGRHHLGHYVCNLLFLAHYVDNYPEGNDLPPPSCFLRPEGFKTPTASDLMALAATIPAPPRCHPADCDPECPGPQPEKMLEDAHSDSDPMCPTTCPGWPGYCKPAKLCNGEQCPGGV